MSIHSPLRHLSILMSIFALIATRGSTAGAAEPPGTFLRDEIACGPTAPKGDDPHDKDIDNDGKIDKLIFSAHWDDGQGNDLTIEEWCMNKSYFSVRLIQSKKGVETVVVSPGGVGSSIDPGHC